MVSRNVSARSLRRMEKRLSNVLDVEWNWYIELRFHKRILHAIVMSGGHIGKSISFYFAKLRNKFENMKYFWRYEEVGEGKLPCYKILFDIEANSVKLKKLIHYKSYRNIPFWGLVVKTREKFRYIKKWRDVEIFMGFYMYKKWKNGFALARKTNVVGNFMEGLQDCYSDGEMKYLKKDGMSWGHSKNLKFSDGNK